MLGAPAAPHTANLGESRPHAVVPGAVKLEASTVPVEASSMYGDSGDAKLTHKFAPTMASDGAIKSLKVAASTTGDTGDHTEAPLLMSAAATATLMEPAGAACGP